MLPFMVLERVGGMVGENLARQERWARIVFLPHAGECPLCREYARELGNAAATFGRWDGRVVVLAPAEQAPSWRGEGTSQAGMAVLLERPGAAGARAQLAVPPESAGVLLADRYGEIWYGCDAGSGHALPDVRELEEWLRYLATQCPE